eukprot:4388907-Ditylum_brightwellii.AAC.1
MKDDYDDGEDFMVKTLMQKASIKYKVLKQQGTWNALSPEQEQLVALNSNIEKLKDDNLKLKRNFKKKDPKSKKYLKREKERANITNQARKGSGPRIKLKSGEALKKE